MSVKPNVPQLSGGDAEIVMVGAACFLLYYLYKTKVAPTLATVSNNLSGASALQAASNAAKTASAALGNINQSGVSTVPGLPAVPATQLVKDSAGELQPAPANYGTSTYGIDQSTGDSVEEDFRLASLNGSATQTLTSEGYDETSLLGNTTPYGSDQSQAETARLVELNNGGVSSDIAANISSLQAGAIADDGSLG